MLEIFQQDLPYYASVLYIKFSGLDIKTEFNVFEADLDIKKVGTLEKVTKAGMNALLVETKSKTQTEILKRVKTITKEIVVIEEHKQYNT